MIVFVGFRTHNISIRYLLLFIEHATQIKNVPFIYGKSNYNFKEKSLFTDLSALITDLSALITDLSALFADWLPTCWVHRQVGTSIDKLPGI